VTLVDRAAARSARSMLRCSNIHDQGRSGTIRRRASSADALPRMRVALAITSPNLAGLHSVTWLGQVITMIGRAPG
jgi:hypothetical protein